MKKMYFAACVAAFSVSVNAQTVKVDSLDRSADEVAIKAFLNTDKEFEAKSNASMPYEDRKIAFVGNDATPVTLEKRIQRGWYLGAGASLAGTSGMWGPKVLGSLGYEGNKWALNLSAGWLKVRPNSQSDWQGTLNAIEFSFGGSRVFKAWHDGHTRLSGYGEVTFRTTLDRQDLGSYENVTVEETETEIITTTESGWRAYTVKPYMFGAELGLELSHQFYNKPWGIYGRVGAGATTQIAGKESLNGSADGVKIKPTCEVEVGIRFYPHWNLKNSKARNMIRH